MTRFRIASSFALSVAIASSPLFAQSAAERTLAETLFREARELMAAGRHREACPKFAESQRLDPGGGTLLNLAVCHEKLGMTATAWGEYREALALARSDRRDDRIKLAEERIAALEPELSRLTVVVPAKARVSGLTLELDGAPLRQAAWGTAFPVDPGERVLVARAPGHSSWRTKLTTAPRGHETVSVPVLVAEPTPDAPPAAAQPAVIGEQPRSGAQQRFTGYVVGGLGIAALGVGSYFGIQAIRKRGQSDDECPNDRCTDEGVRLNDAAKKDASFANIGIGLGLVGVGVGAYLVLSAEGSEPDRAPSAAAGFVPLHRGGAVSVTGAF